MTLDELEKLADEAIEFQPNYSFVELTGKELKALIALVKMQHEALRFNEAMWVEHKFKPHADAQEAIAAYEGFGE